MGVKGAVGFFVHISAARLMLCSLALFPQTTDLPAQEVELRKASPVEFPGGADSNSPAHWAVSQAEPRMYLFNSMGLPVRSEGPDQFHLGKVRAVFLDHHKLRTRWIEATWVDEDGTLYAWYHHEPGGLCPGNTLTAPRIGALRSKDNGVNFVDLGVVLEAPPDIDCDARNGYFAGGNGDFCVVLDAGKSHFYFYFGNYAGKVSQQGVALGRMAFGDRDNPVGKVWKYYNSEWKEPGLGGRLNPIFATRVDWRREDADSFWGPSIHWNTYLQKYVMLLNRSCCSTGWPQEGIYISYNDDIGNPSGWSAPQKILDGPGQGFHGSAWYPQVLGIGVAARETDKVAGKVARLYLGGRSQWEIIFSKE